MLLIVLLGGALSWVCIRLQSVNQQRRAVQAIVEAGGEIGYDYECLPNGYPLPHPTPPGPEWLRWLVGKDALADVVVVDIPNDPGTLAYLARFPKLRELSVGGARTGAVLHIPEDDLKQLEHLHDLRVLSLSHCRTTDAGLRHVGRCTALEQLYLDDMPITCAKVAYLDGLNQLLGLSLQGTNITDQGVQDIHGLTSLTWLKLSDTKTYGNKARPLLRGLPGRTGQGQSGQGQPYCSGSEIC